MFLALLLRALVQARGASIARLYALPEALGRGPSFAAPERDRGCFSSFAAPFSPWSWSTKAVSARRTRWVKYCRCS